MNHHRAGFMSKDQNVVDFSDVTIHHRQLRTLDREEKLFGAMAALINITEISSLIPMPIGIHTTGYIPLKDESGEQLVNTGYYLHFFLENTGNIFEFEIIKHNEKHELFLDTEEDFERNKTNKVFTQIAYVHEFTFTPASEAFVKTLEELHVLGFRLFKNYKKTASEKCIEVFKENVSVRIIWRLDNYYTYLEEGDFAADFDDIFPDDILG